MGCSTLSPLTEQNENRRSIPGYKQRCMPGWLHKAAFRVDHKERPRWVGSRPSPTRRANGEVAPIADLPAFSAKRVRPTLSRRSGAFLFGLTRISALIDKVAASLPGRLLLTFRHP
jgi:hypothetical protein